MKSKKAQFFIISMIIISFSLVGIQFLLSGYGTADTSDPFTFPESAAFWNVKDQFVRTYTKYNCPELERNLDEVKFRAETNLQARSIYYRINYTDPCTGDAKNPITVHANITSFHGTIFDEFRLP